jgi:hypothetical protein
MAQQSASQNSKLSITTLKIVSENFQTFIVSCEFVVHGFAGLDRQGELATKSPAHRGTSVGWTRALTFRDVGLEEQIER